MDHSLWTTFGGAKSRSESEPSLYSQSQALSDEDPFRAGYQHSETSHYSFDDATGLEGASSTTAPEGMQLSHEDLAQVFQRAKELKNLASLGKLPGLDESGGPLERLARRLAGI